MHPFSTYVLRSYFKATGWNEDNLYQNLTRSSDAILDFSVPKGLHLSVSKSTNELFKSSYYMTAMPTLNGSIGYIFSTCPLDVKTSGTVPFVDMLGAFKVYDQPRRPEAKEEEWLAGEQINKRDYLLFGRMYLPSGRLDAVYTTRLSSSLQILVAAISEPRARAQARGNDVSDLMLSLQHDVGKWCTEYTWKAADGMWGLRLLHNFGRLGGAQDGGSSQERPKRVDEEDAVEGGLKGRISAGAELHFSPRERSGGVSAGFRFSTLPDASPPSYQIPTPTSSPLSGASGAAGVLSQPPTTITALFNPIIGAMSGAYSARASRDLSLSSRFDFNLYSYDSEWTMGAEWWLRKAPISQDDGDVQDDLPVVTEEPELVLRREIRGVVKARASTNNNVALMWEGRLRNMLVSLGVVSDFSSRSKPIKAIGLELSYFA